MEPHEIEKWAKVRQKGILHYMLKYSTMVALGFAYLSWSSLNSYKITGFDIAGIAITALISGLILSVIFWYRKAIPYQHINQNKS